MGFIRKTGWSGSYRGENAVLKCLPSLSSLSLLMAVLLFLFFLYISGGKCLGPSGATSSLLATYGSPFDEVVDILFEERVPLRDSKNPKHNPHHPPMMLEFSGCHF